MRLLSIASTDATTTSAYHVTDTCAFVDAREPLDRTQRDEERHDHEEPGLRERREVLRLAVPELVRARRPDAPRHANRKEREQRCDEIRPGVSRLRDEPEAVRREADRQLEHDERRRGHDGDER